jgi:hypothetical protein
MNTEDITAEKLKGNNVLIKFVDGETLFVKIDELEGSEHTQWTWINSANRYLKGEGYQPFNELIMRPELIKYIRIL